jgi:hypothetical protein
MLEDTKFWAGYIVVFVLVTFFVTGLLELVEWTARLLNHTVNPLFLTAGGICAFITILKMYDK